MPISNNSETMKNLQVLLLSLLSIHITLFPSDAYVGANRETLKSVQILFRHGDRTPDIGDMIGLGRLTDKGKKEAFDLGLFLRDRYDDFLAQEYNPDDINVLSSDTDRTIQSASLVAYGLYRNFSLTATWAEPAPVQYEPIPVRHIPEEHDNYFQYSKKCARWDQLYEETVGTFTYDFIVGNPDVIDIYTTRKDNVSLFDPNRSIISRIDPLMAFQDEILYNITHDNPVEDWCLQMLSNQNYFGVKTSYYRAIVDTPEKQRFYSGPLLQAIFNNFEEDRQKKMSLYCAHDKTLFTLMVTLGIEDKQVLLLPPTAAALIFELHENQTAGGEPYMLIWYRNSTSYDPHYLTIPDCGHPCYFSKLKDMKTNIIPINYEAECLTMPQGPEIVNLQGSTLLLWVGTAVIVVVFGMVLFMTRARSRRYDKI